MNKLNEGIFDDLNLSSKNTQNTIGTKRNKVKVPKIQFEDEEDDEIIGEPSQKELISNTTIGEPELVIQDLPEYVSLETQQEESQLQKWTRELENQQKQNSEVEKKQEAEKTLKKSGRKKKIVDSIINQKITEAQQKGEIITNQQKEELKQQLVDNIQQIVHIEQITPDDYANAVEVLKEENNIESNNTEIETSEFIESIGEVIENVPDVDSISDFEIKETKKKTKEGYVKLKVNIKKEGIPEIINQIASAVKKISNGIISPRVCDLRVIGNTNKTQLRNSTLKLSGNTVVFKPDHNKLKVNKGTRIMLSIPDDYNSTGNLLVYLQESRDKTIIEIQTKELGEPISFFSKIIANYYYNGYETTLKRLQQKGVNNPLLDVIETVLSTRDYKIRTTADEETNRIISVDFYTKSLENDFMCARLMEMDELGKYELMAFDTINMGFDVSTGYKNMTITYLEKNILTLLSKFFSHDWKKEIIDMEVNQIKNNPNKMDRYFLDENDNEISEEEYRKNIEKEFARKNSVYRLEHNKLRKALWIIQEAEQNNPEYGIEIEKVLSKSNMKALAKEDYDAELIQGKTNFVDFFVLSYLAYPIKGGDKRAGREYIDRQQYYDKYDVKDRRTYQLRRNTILTKQDVERNYNARIYLFQVQYKIKGKNNVCIYRSKSFADMIEATKFFLDTPVDNVKSPIE